MAIRALYVTSEVYPLAKTGGLADVSAALPAALREYGIDTRVLLPAYPQALERTSNSDGSPESRMLFSGMVERGMDIVTMIEFSACPRLDGVFSAR